MKLDRSRMRQWQSHKTVDAEQILAIDEKLSGEARLTLTGGQTVAASGGFMERHVPRVGGYIVLYEDGYVSYSPRQPFEDGYSVLPPPPVSSPL